ncbi:MAG: hypothetical protein A3K10_10955 [Bacteroidetes bacterium RIFCSPLOWO2_12_FULL_31_6]|nr:MAG: hypothetical protein A3K10_10955 [Bacteroidetes bacterium RIFCSPLOWO2_12_FULL_31_6]
MTNNTFSNTENITNFLSRYEKFSKSQEKNKVNYYQLNYKTLFNKYSKYKEAINEIQIKEADEFNIFKILGVAELEAKTHTPFLVNLLNPKGTHAQGILFYKCFIQSISTETNDKLLDININDFEVIAEKSISGGFIDIFIYHKNSNNRFCIIIENKIYAGDQYQQLERYYNYAQNILKLPTDNIYLIYLKDGNEASDYSMKKSKQSDLLKKGNLLNISYTNHILSFLNKAVIEVQSPNIKHILYQYIYTIKELNL